MDKDIANTNTRESDNESRDNSRKLTADSIPNKRHPLPALSIPHKQMHLQAQISVQKWGLNQNEGPQRHHGQRERSRPRLTNVSLPYLFNRQYGRKGRTCSDMTNG